MLPVTKKAADAPLQRQFVEIQQQGLPRAGQPQVGQYLRVVNWQEPLDAFHLDDDVGVHEKIQPIAAIKTDSLENNGNGYLAFNDKTPLQEYVHKAGLICRLQ